MNSFGLHYQGKDRFVVREEVAELETIGAFAKTETHLNKVGTSERTKGNRTKIIRSMVLENGRFSKTSNTTYWLMGYKLHPARFNNLCTLVEQYS
jgi:valyl-tRNA synthetase